MFFHASAVSSVRPLGGRAEVTARLAGEVDRFATMDASGSNFVRFVCKFFRRLTWGCWGHNSWTRVNVGTV